MNRYSSTKRAGILGIWGNIFLLIIKGIVGFASHSQAMIADAANSAGDIFASLMTFIGNRIASEPGDKTHNFGHGKAEYIFSLFISISMIFVSAKLLYDATISLIFQEAFTFSWFLVAVCISTILVKLFLFLYTYRFV
ncbi:MAG: cation diffusion facilitator family transporter [Clostridia bacterium]|nr:cation diffusion facilitator family transporter [Clostridia bacterium]